MLMGGQKSELQAYLNSKVEVTGTLDPASSGSGSATGTGATGTGATGTGATGTGTAAGTAGTGSTATGTGASASGMGPMQHLRVTSVKQVASTCSGE
jgi:hypothetical protein